MSSDALQAGPARASDDGLHRKRSRDGPEEETSCGYKPVGKRRGSAPGQQPQLVLHLRGLMRRWACVQISHAALISCNKPNVGLCPPAPLIMSVFRCFRWAQALYRLQPKCKVDDLLAENAIAIFDGYVKAVHERVRPRQHVCLELPASMLHRYQIPCRTCHNHAALAEYGLLSLGCGRADTG